MIKKLYNFTSYTILLKTTTRVLSLVPYQVLISSTYSISTHHRLHRTILVLVAVSDVKVIKWSLISEIKTKISKINTIIEIEIKAS